MQSKKFNKNQEKTNKENIKNEGVTMENTDLNTNNNEGVAMENKPIILSHMDMKNDNDFTLDCCDFWDGSERLIEAGLTTNDELYEYVKYTNSNHFLRMVVLFLSLAYVLFQF
ncbi:hypothetical protein AAEX28_01975 [Lentisphaerota bacterium WC36G]|nr:hypothetical protein LJT99_04860 [Lentisphaerae bacterium WC36]